MSGALTGPSIQEMGRSTIEARPPTKGLVAVSGWSETAEERGKSGVRDHYGTTDVHGQSSLLFGAEDSLIVAASTCDKGVRETCWHEAGDVRSSS